MIGALARVLGAARPAMICKLSNPLRLPDRSVLTQRLFRAVTRRMTGAVDTFVAMPGSLANEAR